MREKNQIKNSVRRYVSLFCILAMVIGSFAMIDPAEAAVKTYNQKKIALVKYKVKDYKVLKNKKYGRTNVKKFKKYSQIETRPHYLKKKKGNKDVTFQTWAYLPKSYKSSGDLGNPQAIAVTPDGSYAYVTYPKSKNSNECRIIRFDLKKLESLGVNVPGQMNDFWDEIRKGSNHVNEPMTERGRQFLSCMKVGPWAKMGHGSAMAYNPKDGCLWICSKTGKKKTDIQRINMETFKPDLKINYTMYGTVPMSNNLTFDKKGNIYFFTYSGGGWTPKGTVKIYRGKINLKKSKKITFNLVMQGVKNSISTGIQSAGYNPNSNRIYLVSNSAIMSFPVNKLGKLKKKDVNATIFDVNREFEGLSFDDTGKGYLLVNNQPEILTAEAGF